MAGTDEDTLEEVKKDLRKVMVAQEAYRMDNGSYASDAAALQRATGTHLSSGNVADIIGSANGYKATVRSDGSQAAARQCSVYCGASADAEEKVNGKIVVDL